jgi:uncharacterized protein (DUF2384 family)
MGRQAPLRSREPKTFAASAKTGPHRTASSIESVQAHALETFGTAEKAEHWMSRPSPLFQGKSPKEVIESDPSSVEAALARIDHGVYA